MNTVHKSNEYLSVQYSALYLMLETLLISFLHLRIDKETHIATWINTLVANSLWTNHGMNVDLKSSPTSSIHIIMDIK